MLRTRISKYIQKAIDEINSVKSPRQLSRHYSTPLPTKSKELASYRTRIGLALEQMIGVTLDDIFLKIDTTVGVKINLMNEFPDLLIVLNGLKKVGLEIKAVDTGSVEQAARFDTPMEFIDNKDLILIMAWKWVLMEEMYHPYICDWILVSAKELAEERDNRLELTGGTLSGGKAFVRSKKDPSIYVEDKGNHGKLLRMVHKKRKSLDHNESVREYLSFIARLDAYREPIEMVA